MKKKSSQGTPQKLWGVLAAAGTGSRFLTSDNKRPKQYQYLDDKITVLERSAACLLNIPDMWRLVVTLHASDIHWSDLPLSANSRVESVRGDQTRAGSVLNALRHIENRAHDGDWILVHDAVRPYVPERCVRNLIDRMRENDNPVGGVLALPVTDQVHCGTDHVLESESESQGLWRTQTPQMFRYGLLRKALESADKNLKEIRDEATALLRYGHKPHIVLGSHDNLKITHASDMMSGTHAIDAHKHTSKQHHGYFVGQGLDVHAFGPGDHIMLGGVRIPCSGGLKAHSDGDVAIHALCDAVLGACGLGDIGEHFSDTEERWRNHNSSDFLVKCIAMASAKGLGVHNADISILAAKPKINPYKNAMRAHIAKLMSVDSHLINVKATTTEGLGFIGRSEGIMASAMVSLVFVGTPK